MFVVTGANGFIGSAMVWQLNQMGHNNILVSDTVDIGLRPELLRKLKFDEFLLADRLFERLQQTSASIEAIFHMGACSSTTEMDVEFLRRNNTEYTQHLWEISASKRWPFIYASSGAVYGDGKQGFDDQTSSRDFKPLNPYGWSKANFDVWAEKHSSSHPRWYGLRFFNVFGPNEYHKGEMSSVVFKAWRQIKETGRLRLFRSHNPQYADGHQMRDFVYVKDVTRWMYDLYKRSTVESGIYNMGYGKARTWLDLAHAVFKTMRKPVNIDWIDVPDHIRDQYQYFTEAKMQKLLGQGLNSPHWSLEAGVSDYLQDYLFKEDPFLG